MKPVGFLEEAAGAFGLLTSNDSRLADCKGAGDTIQAKSSQSEGRQEQHQDEQSEHFKALRGFYEYRPKEQL